MIAGEAAPVAVHYPAFSYRRLAGGGQEPTVQTRAVW
jgi:hypothetical protein